MGPRMPPPGGGPPCANAVAALFAVGTSKAPEAISACFAFIGAMASAGTSASTITGPRPARTPDTAPAPPARAILVADDGERLRQHDDRRLQEGVELTGQHHVEQEHRQEAEEHHAGEALDAELVEMKRCKSNGLCCGAGGARMWMEEQLGKRINIDRVDEALTTSPKKIATGCPFCRVMLTDGVTARQEQGQGEGEYHDDFLH